MTEKETLSLKEAVKFIKKRSRSVPTGIQMILDQNRARREARRANREKGRN